MFTLGKNKNFRLKDIDAGHHKVTYKGVPAIKCPFDYVLYQMIIAELQPDLIIEIGTNKGGSALYLGDLLELNGKGAIHTIDLPENKENEILHQHPRIRVFKNGFDKYDTALLANYKTIMVIEDGSHMYEDVAGALQRFAPFVSNGSYFIVEDGIVDDLGVAASYNGGPQKAIREFLAANSNFITDRKWCDFFGPNATFNVNGYLKRIS
ncbi:MAG: class I SAM-dependent methyltransferase [Chitinophagaceae bacterium]|nr:class I SAM-dependent methyltransferase [Chitinophagaceae bacterium]